MSKQNAFENYYALEQLPIVRELIEKNEKLKRKNKELKRLISAISANLPILGGKKKNQVKTEEEDENVPLDVDVVCVKTEGDADEDKIVILTPPAKNNIIYEISESDDAIKLEVVEHVSAEEAEEEAVEEETEEEEAEEKEAEEEEAEEEEAEEEEAEEEEVEEEEVEEEAEEAEEEEEEEEAVEEEAEEEEVYEVVIKGKTYYTTNEKNGVIYGVDKNGDVSDEVGVYVDGKPTFKK